MAIRERVSRKLITAFKHVAAAVRPRNRDTALVLIMGYGRSGTTMLFNSFMRDLRIEAYSENNPRVARDYLLVDENIDPLVTASTSKVVVMKPILDSFDARRLLNNHAGSRTVWMIRNYLDVIASAEKKFGNSVGSSLRNVVHGTSGENWLARGVHLKTIEIIRQLDYTDFSDRDWMGLVWWAVNHTLIVDHLLSEDRLLLVHYESLVRSPEKQLAEIYEFIKLPFKRRLGAYINTASVGKGADIRLHPVVTDMCDELQSRLCLE